MEEGSSNMVKNLYPPGPFYKFSSPCPQGLYTITHSRLLSVQPGLRIDSRGLEPGNLQGLDPLSS
ncbi:hypothetical protein AOLI_G00038270 [Acnodon oligacanthus]